MIQQGLVVGVDDQAHIGDTGVDHVGEHEVNHPVPAAIGDGAGVAVLGQLPQIRVGKVGEDDAVQLVHHFTPPPFT